MEIEIYTEFQDIKHFIRHGKNGYEEKPVISALDIAPPSPIDRRHRNADAYSKLASDLVKEENEERIARMKKAAIERYQLKEKIGEGAFSTVYRAIDSKAKTEVAVKLIKKYEMDSAQQAAVLKEVTIMRQLDHPNVVKLIDFIETDQHYYIVQEFVGGSEIFTEIVKYVYFSEDLSRHVIIQVAEALSYLHNVAGVVHRDLKPENIFYNPITVIPSKTRKFRKSDDPYHKPDEGEFILNLGGGGIGTIKLGDFGLSKQIRSGNSLKTPCGTIGYTAPEIVKDMRYSKEVDMWALGCVLYILLCGFPPFFDDKVEVLTRKVADGHFEFLSPWWDEISNEAKHCVSKLLTVNPLERYTIDDFFNDPWIAEFLEKSKKAQEFQEHQSQLLSHERQHASAHSSISSLSTISSMDSHLAIPPQVKHKAALYSPAAIAMKEVMDISSAVHRMGEEAALLEYQQKRDKGLLPALAEDDETLTIHYGKMKPTRAETVQSNGTVVKGNGVYNSPSPQFMSDIEESSKPFELNLNTATILSRRKKKALMVETC
ncbi:unnamed protein product [Ambrosiozyma monospora]|uniref:Unnamed protein product n=1 Tax=Ambrosiozyma monospora TaxID=43982 RepID=A0A9W6YTI5_AMBMO|nr:unnamed protein product [Ambrosiozyma monospora]